MEPPVALPCLVFFTLLQRFLLLSYPDIRFVHFLIAAHALRSFVRSFY